MIEPVKPLTAAEYRKFRALFERRRADRFGEVMSAARLLDKYDRATIEIRKLLEEDR